MAVIKCKMCGGDLNISEDSKIVECEYCGTVQTIPTADNEKKLNLYNRANRLRFGNEFDKAAGVFESIVAEFPEEAEAYWGLCLCKYGIEYVDDPATGNKIPTCHRTSYDSIFDDSNFEIALEYADPVASKVYREEAKKIDQIQKGILEIANNEDPFDIFICYKETDELGERTADSVYAQEIYNALTKEGYRVFFSRITLEDKLGQEYEPYIFSALNSAKVMLAIGTSYDYFNAVWVKNEWARFLELMKEDKSRVLIPCYKDIDAYDMPAEFRNLQGQDMNKLGFLQDLIRGVNKICRPEKKAEATASKSNETKGGDALVKRGFIFLGDKEFEKADEYFERALDENPENSRAYIGKALCEFKLSSVSSLKAYGSTKKMDSSGNFEKALKYADDAEKKELKDIYESIKNKEEQKRLKDQFENLLERIDAAKKIDAVNQLKTDIEKFGDKIDVQEALNKCDERIEIIKQEEKKAEEERIKAEQERKKAEEIAEKKRQETLKRLAEEARMKEEKKRAYISKTKKIIVISAIALLILIPSVFCIKFVMNLNKYNNAKMLLESGDLDNAILEFNEIVDFKDSQEMLYRAYYQKGIASIENKDFSTAKDTFEKIIPGTYEDIDTLINNCMNVLYEQTIDCINKNDYSNIGMKLEILTDKKYKDAGQKLIQVKAQFDNIDGYYKVGDYYNTGYYYNDYYNSEEDYYYISTDYLSGTIGIRKKKHNNVVFSYSSKGIYTENGTKYELHDNKLIVNGVTYEK